MRSSCLLDDRDPREWLQVNQLVVGSLPSRKLIAHQMRPDILIKGRPGSLQEYSRFFPQHILLAIILNHVCYSLIYLPTHSLRKHIYTLNTLNSITNERRVCQWEKARI